MSQAQAALIWCPFPAQSEAKAVARALLGEGLIACANILPQMHSLFAFEGAIEEAAEAGALFKTEAQSLERAIARLAELHSYDTPTIIGWVADHAAHESLMWLEKIVPPERGRLAG